MRGTFGQHAIWDDGSGFLSECQGVPADDAAVIDPAVETSTLVVNDDESLFASRYGFGFTDMAVVVEDVLPLMRHRLMQSQPLEMLLSLKSS